ncbi:biliverdin-producing heme oxygenase [Kineococcus xinjiangensis]|uniref:biliverdin-producing heme oxygenase n=1 Tax=Kineococcus xinjiangensis TaxID=512762 RepID=UPI001304A176|nr:biliverdin-producing heme oxygenase [Kineococcus xinjiangensis]
MQSTSHRTPSPRTGQSPRSPLTAVRSATSEAHRRLEERLGVLSAGWGAAVHRMWLMRLLGVQEPLEAALAAWAGHDLALPDPAARRRADLVAADLIALGATPADVAALPRCEPVTPLRSRAQALGVCYVLDGSTLGGKVIRDVAVRSGVPAQACTSLTGLPGAGARWRETMRAVDALPAGAAAEAAAAALATFELFEQWVAPAVEAAR